MGFVWCSEYKSTYRNIINWSLQGALFYEIQFLNIWYIKFVPRSKLARGESHEKCRNSMARQANCVESCWQQKAQIIRPFCGAVQAIAQFVNLHTAWRKLWAVRTKVASTLWSRLGPERHALTSGMCRTFELLGHTYPATKLQQYYGYLYHTNILTKSSTL